MRGVRVGCFSGDLLLLFLFDFAMLAGGGMICPQVSAILDHTWGELREDCHPLLIRPVIASELRSIMNKSLGCSESNHT